VGVNYKADLNQRYWHYQQTHFPDVEKFFEQPQGLYGRPPVFLPRESWRNVFVNPDANQQEIDKLLALVPVGERHKWFRSMNSSQALAQSVFGNLKFANSLKILSELKDDEGLDLFSNHDLSTECFSLEHKVDYLGEPRPTSIDAFFSGAYQIAIECKFTETEVGTCSRPRLRPVDGNYESQYCDGSYSFQRGRSKRCSLSELGIRYWDYIPTLFDWKNDDDLNPCPLNTNYQLVRNVLAAGVNPDGTVSPNNGHVALIIDERNPAFQPGGKGFAAFLETKKSLIEPKMLRKCSWQKIINLLREKDVLPWLTDELQEKYGF
jgi:hypothetical protein